MALRNCAVLMTMLNLLFHINENKIEIVDKWPHLGHIITDCVDDNEDILSRKLSLVGQINSILCNFRNVDCLIKTLLVKAYCASFYGGEIWDLSHDSIDSICTAWRKGIRRIYKFLTQLIHFLSQAYVIVSR